MSSLFRVCPQNGLFALDARRFAELRNLQGDQAEHIHLPGKSAGEIGLYFDPAHHDASRQLGGILLLGDAVIGNLPS
jgi:hypothetical protein